MIFLIVYVCAILATRTAFAGTIVDGAYTYKIDEQPNSFITKFMNDVFESKSPKTLGAA